MNSKSFRAMRRGVLVWMAAFCVPLCAWADEVDLTGSWQLTTSCGPSLVSVRSVDVAEDAMTGDLTITATECGTLYFLNDIHVLVSCSSPWTGAVSGNAFNLAASGPAIDDVVFETPFPVEFLGCATPPFARFIAQETYSGTVADNGFGVATEVNGTFGYNHVQCFNTDGNVCYDGGAPGGCAFTLRRSAVSPGTNVVVEPYAGASIVFAEVTSSGVVHVTPLNSPAATVPSNFQLLDTPLYYDVGTTAMFVGTAMVCLPYGDVDSNGFVDGSTPPIDENSLQILHEEGGVFVDRTASRNPVTNTICAVVTSFSQFVFGVSNPGCGDGVLDPGEACDDGNTLDGDCCLSNCQFPGSCRSAGKSLLLLRHDTDATRDKLIWKWLKGAATNAGDLGSPPTTTNYTLCLDWGTSTASLALPSGSNWQATGTTGFKFKSTSGMPQGVTNGIVKSGAGGSAKALVKGKGANLPDDLAPALSTPVTVRLVNDANSVCFEAVYDIADVIKNITGQFKAKTQ